MEWLRELNEITCKIGRGVLDIQEVMDNCWLSVVSSQQYFKARIAGNKLTPVKMLIPEKLVLYNAKLLLLQGK